MELTPHEIRVLGCLAEKEATTPDTYPLSTNALLLACNQRSSRDPVVQYSEDEVTRTLVGLRELELVRTSREGGRVYKHAHLMRQRLGLGDAELALLSVLFLRGPQTPGELRTRTERQHAFATVDDVEQALRSLAGREPPLTAQLERRPGQKESRWAHLIGGESGVQAGSGPPSEAEPVLVAHNTSTPGLLPDDEPLQARVPEPAAGSGGRDALRAELAALREELAQLRARVQTLEDLL
jgi:uncharacterized protein YceH (UPF0502 family)